MHLLNVWWQLAKVSMIREMEFRSNFVLGIIRQILWLGAFLFSLSVIFQHTSNIHGWTQAELIIILALSRIFEGIIDVTITKNIADFPRLIQQGSFDYILTKPLPSQFATAFRTVNIYLLGNVIAGVVLLGITLASGSVAVSPMSIGLFLWVSIMGIAIFYSILITTASLAFFLERLEALWGLMNLYTEPLTTPVTIFPRTAQAIMTYIIPIAFIVFVPAQAITNKIDWHIGVTATMMAAMFLTIANIVWQAGLRRYTSASS